MFNIVKQVINFQDTLYIIKRVIREEYIKEEFVQEYKDYIKADSVLKKEGVYYFVSKIEEVEILPEVGQLELNF